MAVGVRRRRRWWFLFAAALIILLAAGTSFLPLPLRDSDKAQAAEALVAWIVNGQSLPGFAEEYPDAQHMPKQKRFFIICDFVPSDVLLSTDSRVQRITEKERETVFKAHRYDDTDYIFITLKSESSTLIVVEFTNAFGHVAAHYYSFEFRRKLWGLRASGKLLGVS